MIGGMQPCKIVTYFKHGIFQTWAIYYLNPPRSSLGFTKILDLNLDLERRPEQVELVVVRE